MRAGIVGATPGDAAHFAICTDLFNGNIIESSAFSANNNNKLFNSFGFYFVEVRPAQRRFFRLISGSGAYGDGTEAKDVVAYLEGYESWKSRYESRCETSELIHNLGVSKASVSLSRDNSVTLAKMDEDGPWRSLLAQAIEG